MSNNNEEIKKQEAPQEEMKLDDARRVKVLSPGMLVFKRFIRNKLAVAGIIILAVMFLYSFLGPLFSPYSRAQIFTREVEEPGEYATGKLNTDPRFIGDIGKLEAKVLKALGSEKNKEGDYVLTEGQEIPFTSGKEHYTLKVINPDAKKPSLGIFGTKQVATVTMGNITMEDPNADEELVNGIKEFVESGSKQKKFMIGERIVTIEGDKVTQKYFAAAEDPIALSTFNIFTPLLGKIADLQADVDFLHAVNVVIMNGENSISYKDNNYELTGDPENGFTLTSSDGTALFNISRDFRNGKLEVEGTDDEGNKVVSEKEIVDIVEDAEGFKAMFLETIDKMNEDEADNSFVFEDINFTVEKTETEYHVLVGENEKGITPNMPAMTILNSFDAVENKYNSLVGTLDFTYALEKAIADGAEEFEFNGETYGLVDNGPDFTITAPNGDDLALASDIAYGPAYNGIELTVDFVKKLQDAMRSKSNTFSFVDQYGEETTATITIVNANCYVRTMQKATLIDARRAPGTGHLLGTDVNGMDVFTRLMYGGRVSLIVGFVVVFFELIIGVIVGGVSGYFGGVVDTILMRFVELFNAIPFYPMLIILGSVMDNLHTDAVTRLMMTMVILGVLGWTGIARIVRGQILSLREQDFMIAAEATGIRTSRRIFRHLIPNVMPLLIVNATASLGGIILTEATLGFLGLGVKYPMASWGSIINQVNDMQVMKTAWWIWIPAGLFILTTVLGFNFVGDGLRDAFDPKMKR